MEHRSRQRARAHGLRHLAQHGRGAHASGILPSTGGLGSALANDVAGLRGSAVGALAASAFNFVKREALNASGFATAQEIGELAINNMVKAGKWAAGHQEQLESCVYGAAAGFVDARYLTIAGEAGVAALGLYMAVRCGVAFT